jgi:hypothetical protein
MKSQPDFYEAAQAIGSSKYVAELFASITEDDHDQWAIVKKSARVWAVFSGEGAFLIPTGEPTYTVAEFLAL